MSKIDRDDFRATLSLLVSAHIASQSQDGIKVFQDSSTFETVLEAASRLAVKIIVESKKYPKNKGKKKGVQSGLIAIPQMNEIGSN